MKAALLTGCLLLALLLAACSPSPAPRQEAAASSPSSSRAAAGANAGTGTSAASPRPAALPGTPTPSPWPSPTTAGTLEPASNLALDSTLAPGGHPSPTPLPCWGEGGRIETGSLDTALLPDPLEFRVYTPPCYAEQPNRRYPSLYLIHGQSYTDDQWDRLGAGERASALIAAGEAPPFLIVMPRDRRWDQPDLDPFGQAVADVLIPWIDGHYRTRPEREYRAVGGLSRGAGWAVHLALSRWELFGALGGHSTPVFWTDIYHIKEWLSAIPAEQMPRIYLDNPNNDRSEILKSSIWFEKLLTQRNIAHEWVLFTGYHEEKYWQAHVEQYLRWYAEGW